METTSVLFVCMGNICRSPTAASVFEALLQDSGLADSFSVDSAGTHAYNVGSPPDTRSALAAQDRGVDLGDQTARVVTGEDLSSCDYIVAMDSSNLSDLIEACPRDRRGHLHLIMDFANMEGVKDVPDPYLGEGDGFGRVFDMIAAGAQGLLDRILEDRKKLRSDS